MIQRIHEDYFSTQESRFVFVVERPELLRSTGEFCDAVETLEDLCARSSERDALLVRLGIAYAKRTHSTETAVEVLGNVDAIPVAYGDDVELLLIQRLVRAVLLVTRFREFETALQQLDSLHRELRYHGHDALYGLVRRWLGVVQTYLGAHVGADIAFQDALASFRRYELRVSETITLTDHAVLKKKTGCYKEAESLLADAERKCDAIGLSRSKLLVVVNRGIVATRTGNWAGADRHCRAALALQEQLLGGDRANVKHDTLLRNACSTNYERLQIQRRHFGDASRGLEQLTVSMPGSDTPPRILALADRKSVV